MFTKVKNVSAFLLALDDTVTQTCVLCEEARVNFPLNDGRVEEIIISKGTLISSDSFCSYSRPTQKLLVEKAMEGKIKPHVVHMNAHGMISTSIDEYKRLAMYDVDKQTFVVMPKSTTI